MQDETPGTTGTAESAAREEGRAGLAPLLEKVARFYHKAIAHAQKARAWLHRKQLDDEDLIQHFLLGYAGGRLVKTLPTDSEEPARSLRAAGILTGTGAETFHEHLTVPTLDGDGAIVSLSGISLATDTDLLLPGSGTALWNAKVARLYPEILLAMSLADGLSLHKAGFPHACAMVGTHLKPLDLSLLHDAGVRRIVVFGPSALGKPVLEQLAGFSTRCHALAVNEFLRTKGTAELVSEVERLVATVRTGDGRIEPHEHGFAVTLGKWRYEVLGIEKSNRKLKITLKTERYGKLHVDTLDLYHAKARKTLLQDLCCFFEESPPVIDGDLVKLMKLAEDFTAPLTGGQAVLSVPAMTETERQEAEAFGRSRTIRDEILRDFETCGLVGEEANKLLCYLAAISRKTEEPISVLILSSSGAGKSTLQDTTLRLCPPEDVVKLTSLTGKALFYKGAKSLQHKILALEEEAGVSQASYAIRNLISAGELVIETTVKDLGSGRLTTMQNRVEGPTSVFITTTNPDVDPETRSRFFVTGVDESREQTRAILASQRQRRTWEGRIPREEREGVVRKHRNFQRLLKGLSVVNPYAEKLVYADDRLQSRRDQPKYLNLINAVAFLRQMQKTVQVKDGREYVEVDEVDLELANRLAEEILGKSLDDLNAVSRDLLLQIDAMVSARVEESADPATGRKPLRQDIAFTRRDIREYTGWPHARVARYLAQLVDMEFLLPVAGRNGRRFVYVLAVNAQEGMPLHLGRADGSPASQGLFSRFSGPSQLVGMGQPVDATDVPPEPDQKPTKG